MNEKIVKTQDELDSIPVDFDGIIKIQSERDIKISISKKFVPHHSAQSGAFYLFIFSLFALLSAHQWFGLALVS